MEQKELTREGFWNWPEGKFLNLEPNQLWRFANLLGHPFGCCRQSEAPPTIGMGRSLSGVQRCLSKDAAGDVPQWRFFVAWLIGRVELGWVWMRTGEEKRLFLGGAVQGQTVRAGRFLQNAPSPLWKVSGYLNWHFDDYFQSLSLIFLHPSIASHPSLSLSLWK